MATNSRSVMSDTSGSDSVIEQRTFMSADEVNKIGSALGQTDICSDDVNALQGAVGAEAGEIHLTRKTKPPPLDHFRPHRATLADETSHPDIERQVSAAQQLQFQQAQSTMSGPKTPTSAPPVTPGQMLDRRKGRERKIGHRRVDEEGQITFKKIQTSQIMGSIQLGISYAIGSLASKPERDLLMQDFTIVETTSFPHEGSSMTPAHRYSDFKFKAYAPVAFRYFRDLFGIQPDDFLLSLCNYPMRELTNPGASGSIFYLTDDDEFIIKTVQHKEAEFLQKLLPGYYMNLNQNPRTLLPKFFGLYCYQCGGKNVRLVVMNNLLPSFIRLHEKYDLKGSTYKRKANKYERKKPSPTFKDLDFMERHTDGILLEPETYNALVKTIQRDCRVLESFKIMDYSLLVGIHNLDLAKREKMEQRLKHEETEGNGRLSGGSESASPVQVSATKSDTNLVRSKSINRQRLAAFSTAMESIQAEVEAPDQDEDVPPGGIPAKNTKGEHLLMFLGVIDILQSFRLKKKLEHTWKSVLHDGDTVSVHRPGFYAQRFQDFMGKTVFKKIPSSGQHRKFRTMVTSVLALKHSPSKRKGVSVRQRPPSTGESDLPRSFLPKIQSEEGPQEGGASVDSIAPAIVPCPPSPSAAVSTAGSSEVKETWSASQERQKSRANTDPVPMRTLALRSSSAVSKTASVTWDKTEVVSLSQVTIQTESVGSGMSETSSSSTSGLGSTLHTVTWTPPHSVEGSTPTHTEGTPSFTESSSSGDAACPTTPVKSVNKSLDSLPPLGETQVLQGTEMKFAAAAAASMKIIPEEALVL